MKSPFLTYYGKNFYIFQKNFVAITWQFNIKKTLANFLVKIFDSLERVVVLRGETPRVTRTGAFASLKENQRFSEPDGFKSIRTETYSKKG